jgi:hypothetical protein
MLPSFEIKTVHAPAVVTATAVGSAVDLNDYEGPITFIFSSTVSGSGVTNAVKLTHADTSGGEYSDVTGGGFTTVANTATAGILSQNLTLDSNAMKRYLKISFTVTGTGEGVVACYVLGAKKYR